MFNEIWLEECGVCLDEKDFYFKNRCQCKDLVCRDCFFRIDKCPFCRSPYAFTVWQPQHQQHRHFNLLPLLTADDYFRLSDMEIERWLAGLFVPVPGWFPSTSLSSQDTEITGIIGSTDSMALSEYNPICQGTYLITTPFTPCYEQEGSVNRTRLEYVSIERLPDISLWDNWTPLFSVLELE